MKLVKDWVFWTFLYLAVMLSGIAIFVEVQNIRSINDRREIRQDQAHIKASLQRQEDMTRYLWEEVKRYEVADRARRKAREEAKK